MLEEEPKPGPVISARPGSTVAITQKLAEDAALLKARLQVDTDPTEAQQEAGNYAKGHLTLHGLPISLENPKGSTRSGTDGDGKAWSVTLKNDYGYIKRTEGRDGDHVDVFIGPSPETEVIFVVNQSNPKSGRFDEHKVLIGFPTEAEAKAGYLANYQKGWNGLKSIYPITVPQFEWWLEHGDTTKEVGDGTFAKHRKQSEYYYHGSPQQDLRQLREGSYVTPDRETASLMGRFHEETGATWTDDDLQEKYKLGGLPKWKQGREPTGVPTIYRLLAEMKQLKLLNNPYEHVTLQSLPVEKVSEVSPLQSVNEDDDFWNSPPNKEGRKCPGCDRLFKEVEPLPGVEMCEVCERFGTKRSDYHGVSQSDAKAFFEYQVWNNEEDRDSGEIGYLSEEEVKRLAGEWVRLSPADKLRYHRKRASETHRPSVAVDLDGTLAKELPDFDPEVIGDPRSGAKKWMDAFASTGARVIVHTVRGDDAVTKAWLEKHDMPFDHINENPDQPPGTSDKLYADVYWDNRAVNAEGALASSAPEVLDRLASTKSAFEDLHLSIGDNRNSPYWQQALKAQIYQPTWNPAQGVTTNIGQNIQQARERGQRMIRDVEFRQDLASALKPGFALRRFQNYMNQGDFVKDPLDRLLFRGQL